LRGSLAGVARNSQGQVSSSRPASFEEGTEWKKDSARALNRFNMGAMRRVLQPFRGTNLVSNLIDLSI
jgi:hypothetical protein